MIFRIKCQSRGDEHCDESAVYHYPSYNNDMRGIIHHFCEKHTFRWANDNEFGKKDEPLGKFSYHRRSNNLGSDVVMIYNMGGAIREIEHYELDNFLCMDHEIDPKSIDEDELKYLRLPCRKPATHYILIAGKGVRITLCYCDEHRQGRPIHVSAGEWFMIDPEEMENWEIVYEVMSS